jgi:hypothetical protein
MNDTRPNLSTFLLLLSLFAAFFVAQTLDITDNSGEWAQAQAVESALTEAEQQRRKDIAAKFACGPNSAHEWVTDTQVECFTNRGRKAGQVEVAAK